MRVLAAGGRTDRVTSVNIRTQCPPLILKAEWCETLDRPVLQWPVMLNIEAGRHEGVGVVRCDGVGWGGVARVW